MSLGNRNVIIAVGLIALLTILIAFWTWPVAPKLTLYGEENPRSGAYHSSGKNCEPEALASIRDGGKRASHTDACRKEAEEFRLNTNDLIQQTRAANAAQAQANIASQQLWTGWLQTLGGFLTLAAAVGAAVYARDAASHTRDANNIAREAQRAWVSLKAAPKLIRPTGVDDLYIRIEFIAENIGATAATDFNFECEVFFLEQTEKGGVLDARMKNKISEWKASYDDMGPSVLLTGDTEVASIWETRKSSEIGWWKDFIPNNDAAHPALLAAVFYRTATRPGMVQLGWRSWYLGGVGDDGHSLSWIEKPKKTLGPNDMCVEPLRSSLVHAEYHAS